VPVRTETVSEYGLCAEPPYRRLGVVSRSPNVVQSRMQISRFGAVSQIGRCAAIGQCVMGRLISRGTDGEVPAWCGDMCAVRKPAGAYQFTIAGHSHLSPAAPG
jgi:hypothetical protein